MPGVTAPSRHVLNPTCERKFAGLYVDAQACPALDFALRNISADEHRPELPDPRQAHLLHFIDGARYAINPHGVTSLTGREPGAKPQATSQGQDIRNLYVGPSGPHVLATAEAQVQSR